MMIEECALMNPHLHPSWFRGFRGRYSTGVCENSKSHIGMDGMVTKPRPHGLIY